MRTDLRLGTNPAILLVIIGAIFCGLGVRSTVGGLVIAALPAHTTGTVVSLAPSRIAGGAVGNYPVVRFTTASGEAVSFTLHSSNSGQSVGDTLPIAYDPKDPQGSARVELSALGWAISLFAAVFGAGLVGFVIVVQRRQRLRRQAEPPKLD